MSKKYLVILALPMLILFACNKTSSYNNCQSTGGIPTSAEIASLENYLTSKGVIATKDSRGFYYKIINPGYGDVAPTSASTVMARYKGTLTDGTVFDSTATAGSPAIFPLSGVILGWQYGVPLIKKTGIIDLYLPPSLGYGCTASEKIPASSILIFRIELINY